jgi:hypothetical protein
MVNKLHGTKLERKLLSATCWVIVQIQRKQNEKVKLEKQNRIKLSKTLPPLKTNQHL